MDLLLGALVFGQLMDFPFTHLFRPIYGLFPLFTCFGLFYTGGFFVRSRGHGYMKNRGTKS